MVVAKAVVGCPSIKPSFDDGDGDAGFAGFGDVLQVVCGVLYGKLYFSVVEESRPSFA